MSMNVASNANHGAPSPLPLVLASVAELRKFLQFSQHYTARRLGQILLEAGAISADTLNQALDRQNQLALHPGAVPVAKIGALLVASFGLNNELLRQALHTQMGVPSVSLAGFELGALNLSELPLPVLRRLHLLPLLAHEQQWVMACAQVPSTEELAEVEFAVRTRVHLVLAEPDELQEALLRRFDFSAGNFEPGPEPVLEAASHSLEEEALANRPPIIRLINSLLQDAIEQRASDIHLHPGRDELSIVYRIDGSLIPVQKLARSLLPAMISRLKILSGLNIAEHRLPQDGRIQVTHNHQRIDMRLSIIPFVGGEGAVIRLLNKQQGLRALDAIGLDLKDQHKLANLLSRGTGMVLVTGPTGSGKTTTLYAALQHIAKRDLHIVTVEDPVEYELPGMHQIQLLDAIGFSFPNTLRHILRHDPDVIMIGEIRDEETARIALESALTGHLVLSTLHTNDAPGAIVRLSEMGLSPYLIRSAVAGVLAQRLVRLNCSHCRVVEAINPALMERFQLTKVPPQVGAGCVHCRHTGFVGRRAIYELFELQDEAMAALDKRLSASEWRTLAINNGMRTMLEHGLQFVQRGELSFMELYGACY